MALYKSPVYVYGEHSNILRGYCTTYQKLACFVLYLKIINTLWKNNIMHLIKKMFKELKNGTEILVVQAG